jgi:hypothetical protein
MRRATIAQYEAHLFAVSLIPEAEAAMPNKNHDLQKILYPNKAAAKRGLAGIKIRDQNQSWADKARLETYYSGKTGSWHVGHRPKAKYPYYTGLYYVVCLLAVSFLTRRLPVVVMSN